MTTPSVLVIGGGLAGLAATVALASRGFRVTLLEARPRLGGRASSFLDRPTEQLLDNCQHVSMGCCTNFLHFCRTIGIEKKLAPQRTLYFLTTDRRCSVMRADPWPAPVHLGRSLASAHYLSIGDKVRIGYGLLQMARERPDHDPPLWDWLRRHYQTEQTIAHFWNIVLVSALNGSVDQIGLRYARKVFVDGFLKHRDGFTVLVPTVPLGDFYGQELSDWLNQHRVQVVLNAGVKRLLQTGSHPEAPLSGVLLRDGVVLSADQYVLAVPFERVRNMLPDPLLSAPEFQKLHQLAPSPIMSVHLWYSRPITTLPHAVFVGSYSQWLFNRGETSSGEFYYQIVMSAADLLPCRGRDETLQIVIQELQSFFPLARQIVPNRAKVIVEHHATFRASPGIDEYRPPQRCGVPNLALAGDWTNTGWPATMEGAVRSGYLAAEVILSRYHQCQRVVQEDLGCDAWLAKLAGLLPRWRLK